MDSIIVRVLESWEGAPFDFCVHFFTVEARDLIAFDDFREGDEEFSASEEGLCLRFWAREEDEELSASEQDLCFRFRVDMRNADEIENEGNERREVGKT